MRPCVPAHGHRQSRAGQVRECTGPAMHQHTYTQRARHTHSPARLPVPVGRHPGHCLLVKAPSAQHCSAQHSTTQRNTTQHSTAQDNTTQNNTAQHNTTQHSTTQHNTTQRNTPQHSITKYNTAQHSRAQCSTSQHSTAQHCSAQHSTAQHNTTQGTEYSPALPMGWVPGAKPRTTGPGHCQ